MSKKKLSLRYKYWIKQNDKAQNQIIRARNSFICGFEYYMLAEYADDYHEKMLILWMKKSNFGNLRRKRERIRKVGIVLARISNIIEPLPF